MKIFSQIWSNFKARPDIWFFYGFLLTFTLSIRKVLKFYPLGGQLNEYSGIYLYLSDIFLILTMVMWGHTILYNNIYSLSSIATRFIIHIKNVPRGTFLLLPLILVIWSFLSLIWADNKIIALLKSLKLAEFYLLYLYVIYNVSRLARETKMFHMEHFGFLRNGTISRRAFQIIIALGFIQALIGIWQFIIQHSVGLFWLKESLLSPDMAGVAKIMFHGDKFIRAYGLFPHPNILGGFLLASISLTWIFPKLFHARLASTRLCDSRRVEHFSFMQNKSALKIILAVQIIALILTLSKSALISLTIATGYLLWKQRMLFHARLASKRLCDSRRLEKFWRRGLLSILILAFSLILAKPNLSPFLNQSLQERIVYLNVSRGTILSNPVIGVGSGQFVLNMDKNVPRGTFLEPWQYQPVHNVFLLIWSELGIIGLLLFVWLLWKLFHSEKNVPRLPRADESLRVEAGGTSYGPSVEQNYKKTLFKAILLGFTFIMLFDHYFWDIQQGQIMLWMALGILAGIEHDKQHLD